MSVYTGLKVFQWVVGGGPESDYSVCPHPLCQGRTGQDRTGRDAGSGRGAQQ